MTRSNARALLLYCKVTKACFKFYKKGSYGKLLHEYIGFLDKLVERIYKLPISSKADNPFLFILGINRIADDTRMHNTS